MQSSEQTPAEHTAENPAQNNPQKKEKGWGKRILTGALVILLALLLFFAGWIGHWLSLGERAQSLLWAIDTAEKNYYLGVDGDFYDKLFAAFSLDPYSQYYSKEDYESVQSASRGERAGTGITVGTQDGRIRVVRISGNSPADRAGLLEGMYIHRFGGETLTAGSAADLLQYAEEHGSFSIEAGFAQDGKDAKIYAVTRQEYLESECLYRDSETALRFLPDEKEPYHASIGALESLPQDVAYVRIDRFYAQAAEEFEAALSYMVAHGKRHLLIDLRENGGGYLSVFCEIAAHLMRTAEGDRPVAAVARYGDGREEYFCAPANDYGDYFGEDSSLYVLADENTASASECLIGALVSYGMPCKNIFLREEGGVAKTYGKGIMQSHYTDLYGNVLKLTSAEIFWPSGKSIHGKGVTPSDGAIPIEAPVLPGANDEFLAEVCARIRS